MNSLASLDELTEAPDIDDPYWFEDLEQRLQVILDRKRSSVQGREEALNGFIRVVKYQHIADIINPSDTKELLAAFCRSITAGSSEKETTLALRALELLTINVYDNTIYENVEPILKRAIQDSTSVAVKAAAIHCLGACAIHGGAGEESIMEHLTFLLDVVASDGQSIGADDDAPTVTAALQEWGLLATEIDDLESESEEAVQIFMDQLDSSDLSVQIAAGENIALLYEKSYTPQEGASDIDDEDQDHPDDGDNADEDASFLSNHPHDYDGPRLIKRYNAYHNTPELERQLQALATVHSKRISKRDKKSLHSNFASILTTVGNPRLGPMYSTALNQETNRHYGSKLKVKVGGSGGGVMTIDRWWKLIRLNSLRRILQGGFSEQYYQGNRNVLDSLPVMVHMAQDKSRSSAKKAARFKNNARTWAFRDHSPDDTV